jgi:hypothetical protein
LSLEISRLRLGISDGCRNGQLNLRTGFELAPNREFASDRPGALLHPGQAVVSDLSALLQNSRINPLSVVADPNAKLPLLIMDFSFDSPRGGVPERVAQRLSNRRS